MFLKLREWWEIEDQFDPVIRDAGLTDRGVDQARALQADILTLDPALIILSPLTRNLHTASESCKMLLQQKGGFVDVIVTPIAREHTYSTCDLGSSTESLQERWPEWSTQLSEVPPRWWAHSTARVDDDGPRENYREPWQHLQNRVEFLVALLEEELRKRPGRNILLVGHAVLFYALTGKWLANCELFEFSVSDVRPRCSCTGHACICKNPHFDSLSHT